MNILNEAYSKTLAENEKNIHFWENYLQNLKSLNFSEFSQKLKLPALVPIGSRILFRGKLKHTSELTVALGADYFVKCSLSQAEVLRQHRIEDAQSKLDTFIKEKEYLENHMTFTKRNVYETEGHEILEYQTEEEDKAWRDRHRENVRKYKQNKVKEEEEPKQKISDEELWNRLEELELQEELENELLDMKDTEESKDSFIVSDNFFKDKKEDSKSQIREKEVDMIIDRKEISKDIKPQCHQVQIPRSDLLHQVIDRQNELEKKLQELKTHEKSPSKTEQDILSKLDELEQLEEMEDEMDRLDDIIENEDSEENDKDPLVTTHITKLERRVSFVDEDDGETLQLTFKHSPLESNNDLYDPKKGILKPSDIYQAYSKFFGNETTSILKKSKYDGIAKENKAQIKIIENKRVLNEDHSEPNEEIVIKDVIENVEQNHNTLEIGARPTSLFKKRRMQSKSHV